MKFSFKSLRSKLFLFIALVILIVVLFSMNLLVRTIEAKNKSAEIEMYRLPISQATSRLVRSLDGQFLIAAQNSRQYDTLEFYKTENVWSSQIVPDINFIVSNKKLLTSAQSGLVDSLSAFVKNYRELQLRSHDWIVENYVEGKSPGDSSFVSTFSTKEQAELTPLSIKMDRLSIQIQNALTTVQTDNEASITESIALIKRQAFISSWLSILFIGIAILILGVGGYLIINNLNRSIKNPSTILKKLVDGDTSQQAVTATDEMRTIAESSNKISANMQRASAFAQSIGEGNFNFDFQPLSEKDVLGNSLLQMRDKLKSISEADRKKSWASEGLAKFADIMRRSEDDTELAHIIISELVKYTKSHQGGLFILNRDNEEDLHLQLTACYAFERRKYLEKRMEIGEGLLGQCYLEGQRIYLENVPSNYVLITSGLGIANANSVLIVPLKVNESIEGVMELASFRKFEAHEIEFVEKVGEIVASTISSSRINQRTKMLLAESQEQSEQMRAQEEEMRQNMEEMQATQEQMQRQADEMKKIQNSLELERSMLQVLMEYLPDRITYKDRESRILRVSKAKAIRFNIAAEDFIGKTDYDFFDREHADKAMKDEKALLDLGKPLIDLEERYIMSATGDVGWNSTSRVPFRNERDEIIGMIIITKDITQLKNSESGLKDREKIIERLLDDMKVFRYVVGRDSKVHQVWKSKALRDFNPSILESKEVKDCFPEVFYLISQQDLEDTNLICKDRVEINGEKEVFKHFLFRDSAHDGVYLGFALKQ